MSESRIELISWLNDLLQLGVVKVEQVGQGAIPCQILDSIWRDVPLHRVKFTATHEYEYISNFKIFQTVLGAHGISKEIPVERLVKLKMQDNLEFLQWLKKLWDASYQGPYDAISRRQALGIKATAGLPSQMEAVNPRPARSIVPVGASPSKNGQAAIVAKRNSFLSPSKQPASQPNSVASQLSQENAELKRKNTELSLCIDRIEKERDFYFKRLREVEILCQNAEKNEHFDKVLQILYANPEEANDE